MYQVAAINHALDDAIQARIDNKTKPWALWVSWRLWRCNWGAFSSVPLLMSWSSAAP